MSDHIFKTIYFPRERVRGGTSARLTVSIPAKDGLSKSFVAFFGNASSRDFRAALGDPFVEDLENEASRERRSLSSVCVSKLVNYFETQHASPEASEAQLSLELDANRSTASGSDAAPASLGVTFRDSLRQGVYGWFPYVEGFSATYTRDAILRYQPRFIFDPFGGAGTTQLAAATLGIPSAYSEVNPFMCFVAETKVTATRWARRHMEEFESQCNGFLRALSSRRFQKLSSEVDLAQYQSAFPDRDFFVERDIRELLAAVSLARHFGANHPSVRDILLLACAANAVRSSNMTRRADLRRRRPDEYKNRIVDVREYLRSTVLRFMRDVRQLPRSLASTSKASDDVRALPEKYAGAFDFALTSPPYLNGTNYFRNTKIELWLLGFISNEDELSCYRQRSIAAGINNVTRDRAIPYRFDDVEQVASQLEATDGDRRISLLVRQYFSDMHEMFLSVHRCLNRDGTFLLDIGDSKFYGVHVPTDRLLTSVAAQAGFQLAAQNVLARRHSRDKSPLTQVELIFAKRAVKSRRSQKPPSSTQLESRIADFQVELPYKVAPYTKRNWGHALHSLCSYQGKLKPAIAHWLLRNFVPKGGRVLDPLGGVGTIPFEAALLGHSAVSNDLSPLAATVAAAKLAPPTTGEAESQVADWWKAIERTSPRDVDLESLNFGLNGKVRDYFHPDTLDELLRARAAFARQRNVQTHAFAWASLLHVLHGNRPYAISRTSHPITPFHPTGPFLYRSVKQKVLDRAMRAASAELPPCFVEGQAIHGDFRKLTVENLGRFSSIITSPPFLGMRFDRPNWLRLWLCGWNQDDFLSTSQHFLERQQVKSSAVYGEFFSALGSLLDRSGVLIVHVGSGGSRNLAEDLKLIAQDHLRLRGEIIENVQSVEQHGIRDKGLTTQHHFLVLSH